jgi:UDP-N-acetylglucosamine transferase subunit ALG13
MTKNRENAERPLICLSAAGGGHFRQLLDIEPLWSQYAHFFVTENTVLTRALSNKEDIENIPHFALGQMRIGKSLAMVRAACSSCLTSLSIILRRRPDIVITTGSGSQYFILLWARLFGAKIVLLDSFARFHAPSKFARLAGPLAHLKVAQSAQSSRKWHGSRNFDPLEIEPSTPNNKERLLFATVGATLPYPRLENAIVELKRAGKIPEKVILQVGCSTKQHEPVEGLQVVADVPFGELQDLLDRADLVVCHAGTGSILTALAKNCAVVAMPRSIKMGDHYDNHQDEIATVFEGRGLIQTAEDATSLVDALDRAREAPRHQARMNHQRLMAFLHAQFSAWFPRQKPHGVSRAPSLPADGTDLAPAKPDFKASKDTGASR